MLPLSFLHNNHSGMEFLEWQGSSFYDELTAYLGENISPMGVLSSSVFEKGSHLKDIIKKYTGFANIKLFALQEGNLAVDSGYMAPNAILNNQGLDKWLDHTNTTLYRWFKNSKDDVFKGHIDYNTGKVSGAFSELPFGIYINVNLHHTFKPSLLKKFNVTLPSVLAGAIVHEVGHMFTGCMLVHDTIKDNMLLKAGLRFYKEAKTTEERITIIKDTRKLLDIKEKDGSLEEVAKSSDENAYILYYNQMIKRRNNNRALSLGVTEMTSEVLADMYAIRMGCHEGAMNAISLLVSTGILLPLIGNFLLTALMVAVFTAYFGAAVGVAFFVGGTFSAIVTFFSYFSIGYSGIYNANHRRLDDGVRQLIAKLKEDKNLDPKGKVDLINQLDKLMVLLKEVTPWYENTFVRRFMGRVMQLSDFKYVEIEHFTSTIQNHEVIILGHKLEQIV